MSELRVVATGLCFPEGPVAMRGRLGRAGGDRAPDRQPRAADGTVQVIAHTGGGPNGLAVGPDGAFYVCNNGGFAWRLEDNLFRPAMVSSDYVSGSIQRVDPRTGAVSRLVRSLRRQPAERAERHRVRRRMAASISPISARPARATATTG